MVKLKKYSDQDKLKIKLTKLANAFDLKGLYTEANIIDNIIKSYAEDKTDLLTQIKKFLQHFDSHSADDKVKLPEKKPEDKEYFEQLLKKQKEQQANDQVELPEKQPGDKEYFEELLKKQKQGA